MKLKIIMHSALRDRGKGRRGVEEYYNNEGVRADHTGGSAHWVLQEE
jgi:hypothetical protein